MRCLLRVFGHTSWEDYCMEPSTEDRNTLSKSLRDVALKHIGGFISETDIIHT